MHKMPILVIARHRSLIEEVNMRSSWPIVSNAAICSVQGESAPADLGMPVRDTGLGPEVAFGKKRAVLFLTALALASSRVVSIFAAMS